MRTEIRSVARSEPPEQGTVQQTKPRNRFKVNLVIFVSVNALLLLAWAVLTIAGVHLHGFLWPWAVVVVLWSVRLVLEGRAAHRDTPASGVRYSEERIRREMDRLA